MYAELDHVRILEFFTVKKLFATSSNISHSLDAVKFPVVARYNQIKSVFHSNSHSGATKDPQITHPQNAIFIWSEKTLFKMKNIEEYWCK